MAFTHGTIYIQNVTRFFVILLALTVDISLVRRLPVGSARALPPVSLLTWEMSTIGPPKFQTNLVYIWMEIVPAVTHIWSSIRVHSLSLSLFLFLSLYVLLSLSLSLSLSKKSLQFQVLRQNACSCGSKSATTHLLYRLRKEQKWQNVLYPHCRFPWSVFTNLAF